jgi:hypothetical protein
MMDFVQHINIALIVAIICGLLALYYLLEFIFKLKAGKLIASTTRLFLALLFSCVCFVIAMVTIGTQGYKSLTKEEMIAIVKVIPRGQRNFDVRLIFNNGQQQVLSLKGDQFLIDAYILKWQPWANILGLHTAYRLERASGRYLDIEQEKAATRTVFAIKNTQSAGIAEWRKQYKILSLLLDVENGSASFIDVDQAASYQLFVTTNGLLIRPLGEKL